MVALPADAQEHKISASCKKGVLIITPAEGRTDAAGNAITINNK